MKICPECAFANEERFPACLWCNTLLVNVKSTPAADPAHPEHFQRRLHRARHHRRLRQLAGVLICYMAAIVLLAVVPGYYFDLPRQAAFGASALVVGLGIVSSRLGVLSCMLAQGALSTFLVLRYGAASLLVSFMLLGHVVLPSVFAHWVNLQDSAEW